MSDAKYTVGIDLGTTHCALAVVNLEEGPRARSAVVRVPQLVRRGEIEARELLPSFVYYATEGEGDLGLPWDTSRRFAVGEFARERARETPGRVISSAKSWLTHTGVDRRSEMLPVGAPADIEKISPVESAWRYLDHLSEAWAFAQQKGSAPPLVEQQIVITVPASFDAAARDLTIEAAYAAGMEDVTLLEEPQAALYAWIEQNSNFRELIAPGDIVLVIDVGGGTTDFSAIAAVENEGKLELHRIAVGEHILLGGDNMDLALAHRVGEKLKAEGHKLDRQQTAALAHACRGAKERILSDDSIMSEPVALAARGSQLVGGTVQGELTRDDVEQLILDGFFPRVAADAVPLERARAGLRQMGLPYAEDAAVTKHLAKFLRLQAGAGEKLLGREGGTLNGLLHAKSVLFNGGVLKSARVRERLLATLNDWLGADGAQPVTALPGADPDLAVARGAAYFGLVRRGRGLMVRGGTARAYYVGIESPAPAVPGMAPPTIAVCVAPFGLDEGSPPEVLPQELGVIVGEAVEFRFFGSTVRRDDVTGNELEDWSDDELVELSPIAVTFAAEGRDAGDFVPVRLRASITPVGTLLLEALPLEPRVPGECFKVELSVRKDKADE